MVDKKITELDEELTPTTDDLLVMVDTQGSPDTNKVLISTIFTLYNQDTKSLTNTTLDSFTNTNHADAVHIEMRNETGSALTKGDVVYISGYSVGQDKPLVSLANSGSASTMPAIAMLRETTLANNATGRFIITGRISSVDTSAFTAGQIPCHPWSFRGLWI
jgi:hypothetical protein